MLGFRKTRHFFTQKSVFYMRKQPKTSFPGSVFRVEIGVFFVTFVIFVYFQLRSPTNVLLERTQKNPVAPYYGGFVAWRLQNGLFFLRKSRFSRVLRALNCSIFGLFEYFRCPNIMPPLVLKARVQNFQKKTPFVVIMHFSRQENELHRNRPVEIILRAFFMKENKMRNPLPRENKILKMPKE